MNGGTKFLLQLSADASCAGPSGLGHAGRRKNGRLSETNGEADLAHSRFAQAAKPRPAANYPDDKPILNC